MTHYDLLVIGSGPAGQKAAIQAAKLHKRVALIEKDATLGGACVSTGTLPSKTLRDTIYHLHGFTLRSFETIAASLQQRLSFQDLLTRKDLVIQHERKVVASQLQRNGIEIIRGTASFLDSHTLTVATAGGISITVTGSHIIIATGSRPRRPPDIAFDDRRICDSDSVLATEEIPRSLVVLGGGVIGCEYASMLAAFGITVTLIDRRTDLLRFIDQEIVEALSAYMDRTGVVVRLGQHITNVTLDANGRPLTTLNGNETIVSDMVLYAMGRIANIDQLNLAAAGLAPDAAGQLAVNEHYQTAVPHIYAAGDVIGFPALAATSMEQGRLASCHAFQIERSAIPALFPYGIYTVPEISAVGQTEEELTALKIPYGVGRAWYREIARGQIVGDLEGLLKLLFHRETRKLLGVHIIGEGATELIHIGQAVMTLGGTMDFFVHNVFNYPTLAECYRTAALDGINRLPHT